ncbi:hypothetical protein [Phenylobacterium sp.]|uniref:AMP-binding enzyme n=1 Tax=Phenylobacterium sp. TaxID=1871053 RepID=UPI003457B914
MELGEVQHAILACPQVKDAVVRTLDFGVGERSLVAYVTLRGDNEPDATLSYIKENLAGRLPDYLRPSAYMVLPAMPLTANGKLDSAALPLPQRSSGMADVSPALPYGTPSGCDLARPPRPRRHQRAGQLLRTVWAFPNRDTPGGPDPR